MTFEANPHLPKMFESENGLAPKAPTSANNTGVERIDLLSLVLKSAFSVPHFTADSMSRRLYLPQIVLVSLIEELRNDLLLEAKGQDDDGNYRYTISERGRTQAERYFAISGYVGPAPVSLEAYLAMLQWQLQQSKPVKQEDVERALSSLTLPDKAVEVAGMAASSGKSLFLSGPPGNGKTSLARALHNVLPGSLWIPHAIAVDNNIICLYDPHCHEIVDEAADASPSLDQRWVHVHRPLIVVGGEMTMESLDLAYRESLRYYEAPLHMKANGGTFLIDDFGRQQLEPEDLLNRWIIPMEHRFDFLTLHSGQKIEVPFMLMLIFATNLNPRDVTDPAFLRRLGYRLQLSPPSDELYTQIFRQYAAKYDVPVSDEFIAMVMDRYKKANRELRSCEPRDLIERIRDICRYQDQPFELNTDGLSAAWQGYFGEEVEFVYID